MTAVADRHHRGVQNWGEDPAGSCRWEEGKGGRDYR